MNKSTRNKVGISALVLIGVVIMHGLLFKDWDVNNVFDEIYFSGAPKELNYHILSFASAAGTGCIERRTDEHATDLFGGIITTFNKKCLWSEQIESIGFDYSLKPHLIISVIFHPIDVESKGTIYFFEYDVKKKALNVSYRHNYHDKSKQIDTDATHKIPEAYYEKYHTSREAMIKEADDILYGHLLPLYFDRNSKGIFGSRFSINKLGTYTVEYHF